MINSSSSLGIRRTAKAFSKIASLALLSAFLPVVLGVTLLDDEVPSGPTRVMFVAALVVLAVGVGLLGRSRALAYDRHERRDDGA